MKTSSLSTLVLTAGTLPLWLMACGDRFEDCTRSLSCPPAEMTEEEGDGGAGGMLNESSDAPVEVYECADGETQSINCGLNERGEQVQSCADGIWQDEGDCDDPDECVDEEEGRVECGRGDLGTAQRNCIEGVWSAKLCRHPDNMISAGAVHTCAVRDTGKVYCWGSNHNGALGIDNADHDVIFDVPAQAVDLSDIVAITAGGESNQGGWSAHTCALNSDGKVYCWGSGTTGQLGHGVSASANAPVEVLELEQVVKISAGPVRSCAMDNEGKVVCWGSRTNGTASSNTPRPIDNLPLSVELAVGHSFFIVSELGQIFTWIYGGAMAAPTRLGTLDDFTAVGAASSHACAIREGGSVACWGANSSGQLGNGIALGDEAGAPITVPGVTNAVTLTAGGAMGSGHVCFINTEGRVHCWGRGLALGGGNSSAGNSAIPVQVVGLNDAISIAAGQSHTCAMRADHSIACWGEGTSGKLGYGDTHNQYVPVPVEFPVE